MESLASNTKCTFGRIPRLCVAVLWWMIYCVFGAVPRYSRGVAILDGGVFPSTDRPSALHQQATYNVRHLRDIKFPQATNHARRDGLHRRDSGDNVQQDLLVACDNELETAPRYVTTTLHKVNMYEAERRRTRARVCDVHGSKITWGKISRDAPGRLAKRPRTFFPAYIPPGPVFYFSGHGTLERKGLWSGSICEVVNPGTNV
jgi:hypothetical protein